MSRTLRTLATITLIYAAANVFYSLSQLTTYVQVFDVLPQVLRTTGVTLGLATAIVALVASAHQQQWRWLGPLLFLALVNPYGGFSIDFVFSMAPALNTVSMQVGLMAFLLGYLLPPLITACTVLAYTLPHRDMARSHGKLPELEYSSLKAQKAGQSS